MDFLDKFKHQLRQLHFFEYQWPILFAMLFGLLIIKLIFVLVKSRQSTSDIINDNFQLLSKKYSKILGNDIFGQTNKRMSFPIFMRALDYHLNTHSKLSKEQTETIQSNTQAIQKLSYSSTGHQDIKTKQIFVRTFKINDADPLYVHLKKICSTTFNHLNLCKTLEVFMSKEDQILYVVEECVQGQNLKDLIDKIKNVKSQKLNAAKVASIAKQCLKVLKYLHDQGWAHTKLSSCKIFLKTDISVTLIGQLTCAPFDENLRLASEMVKKDVQDLRNVLIELKCAIDHLSSTGLKQLEEFIDILKVENNIPKIFQHDFLRISAAYGPRARN